MNMRRMKVSGASLTISEVSQEDEGLYTIRATNSLGSSNYSFFLDVIREYQSLAFWPGGCHHAISFTTSCFPVSGLIHFPNLLLFFLSPECLYLFLYSVSHFMCSPSSCPSRVIHSLAVLTWFTQSLSLIPFHGFPVHKDPLLSPFLPNWIYDDRFSGLFRSDFDFEKRSLFQASRNWLVNFKLLWDCMMSLSFLSLLLHVWNDGEDRVETCSFRSTVLQPRIRSYWRRFNERPERDDDRHLCIQFHSSPSIFYDDDSSLTLWIFVSASSSLWHTWFHSFPLLIHFHFFHFILLSASLR